MAVVKFANKGRNHRSATATPSGREFVNEEGHFCLRHAEAVQVGNNKKQRSKEKEKEANEAKPNIEESCSVQYQQNNGLE